MKIAASLAHVESSIFIASKLSTLVNISGTAAAPNVGSKLSSVTLSHSATTFMGAYEVPSAGDWSIHRGGAVMIENAEKSVIDGCKFDQVNLYAKEETSRRDFASEESIMYNHPLGLLRPHSLSPPPRLAAMALLSPSTRGML